MNISAHGMRLALTGALALVLFSGCGGCGEEEPASSPQKAVAPTPAPTPKPRVTQPAQTPGASIAAQIKKSVKLPPYYPSDAPVYPGAKANSLEQAGGRISAVFSSTDSADTVTSWMNDFFASEGWENVTSNEVPSLGTNMQGSKGGRRLSVLVASADADGETVTLFMVATDP
jgi:hypothetical protein